MEDAVLDKGSEDPFESESDIAVDKGLDSKINADLSENEVSDSLLCDGVINMLRKMLETKQTCEIVRNETLKRQRNNEHLADNPHTGAAPKAYSRCSIPYFLDVVKTTCKSKRKIELVRGIGFAYLLELDDSVVPRPFTQWVAVKVSVKDELIIINNKGIPLNAESVFPVFGIPAGETIISTSDDGGKEDFLMLFGLSEVPTIKFFGNKIINEEELSDDQFIRCFMVVALATFLCPTSNTKPKYMGALLDVSKIKDLNWCKFTHTWLMQAISKYQKEKLKQNRVTLTLGGCIYHLAVRCLDFIDFGPIQLQSTMPRICVWKGNLIKLFSEALVDKNGAYRACKIKNESETCYGQENHGWASTERYSYLKAAIEKTIRDTLNEKVKEDLYLSFQHYMKDEGPNTCSKTIQIESSDNQHNSTNVQHDSDATVKVNSNGEYEEEYEEIMCRKKRRVADQIERSTHEAPQTSLVKGRTLSQQSSGSVGTHSKAKRNLTGDEQRPHLEPSVSKFQQSKTIEDLQHMSKTIPQGDQLLGSYNIPARRSNDGGQNKQGANLQDKFMYSKAGSTADTSQTYLLFKTLLL